MKLHELFQEDLEEGLAKWAGIAGLGAAALFGNPSTTGQENIPSAVTTTQGPTARTNPQVKNPPAAVTKPSAGTALKADAQKQNFIRIMAAKSGLRGDELAAFLAQTAHETSGFRDMTERGDDAYFTNLYDIQGNPAKAAELGNVRAGDGPRYRGRGFIHLTGRDNYRKAGAALKMDLENHPNLAANPVNAAKIALWFWKNRVQPAVSNWDNVRSVTHKINPAMKGLEDRQENYNYYKKILAPVPKAKKKT